MSGTGAVRLACEFLKRYLPNTTVYIPNPTWPNHFNIVRDAGLQSKEYTYFDAKTKGINFQGFIKDIEAAPAGSTILLHACAHNPTGCDLN